MKALVAVLIVKFVDPLSWLIAMLVTAITNRVLGHEQQL
jgi:hypothetical protein